MEKISYPKEIQLFFDDIVIEIRKILDPELILIAGSFGKDSWLFAGDELISDFEFVFVCQNSWSIKKKKRLLNNLNNKYPYDISLKGYLMDKINKKIISNYSYQTTGYLSLDFFDTFSSPVYLYNKKNKNLNIKCTPNEIPIWEAWRLIVNRIGDILSVEYTQENNQQIINYYWLKIFESFADAYCIVNKTYHNNISKRLESFNEGSIENDFELHVSCKNSFAIIQQALKARQDHDLSAFKNSLSSDENKSIVLLWLEYFEKKISYHERLNDGGEEAFFKNYLSNKLLQNKYLEYNLIVSNAIRLIYNPKKLSSPFKYYNFKYSWKHLIMLCVSSIFKEHNSSYNNFSDSKKIASILIEENKIKNLDSNDFVMNMLDYWKILR